MPKRLSKTEKLLGLIEGIILETGSIMYPYKGIGKEWRKNRGALSKAIFSLRDRGYLEVIEEKARKEYRLTKKGKLKIWQPKISKEWDGRWRILMFDISDDITRNILRKNIKYLGFKMLQKSVWICPYDVTEEVEELLDILDLGDKVDYLITTAITSDDHLKSMFEL